jgi:RND family efflux transporter MFP subunit
MEARKPNLEDLRIDRSQARKSSGVGWGVIVVVVLLAAAVAAGFWWFKRPDVIEIRTVAAREAGTGSAERTVLNASGYVTARREATVSSKVTGKVTEVLIEEGMKVQEGQVLARLDDTNIRASLRLAEAQSLAATNALAEIAVRIREARLEFRRQTDLARSKIATQANLDSAEASVLALEARFEQQKSEVLVAERQVASWQQQLDDTIIRAPFAGIVTSKNAQPGEMISPVSAGGGFTRTGICTIVDMDSLEIEIDVNESYINRVTAGQKVEATLDAYPEWKIPCKVIAIIPTADRQKSTVRVRVGFDQLDPRILPQMSVKVAFREASQGNAATGGVIVPKAAVQQREGRDVVFVARDGRVERRAVTASAKGEEVVISAGIAAGEKVVVQTARPLDDGLVVRESAK